MSSWRTLQLTWLPWRVFQVLVCEHWENFSVWKLVWLGLKRCSREGFPQFKIIINSWINLFYSWVNFGPQRVGFRFPSLSNVVQYSRTMLSRWHLLMTLGEVWLVVWCFCLRSICSSQLNNVLIAWTHHHYFISTPSKNIGRGDWLSILIERLTEVVCLRCFRDTFKSQLRVQVVHFRLMCVAKKRHCLNSLILQVIVLPVDSESSSLFCVVCCDLAESYPFSITCLCYL